MKAQKFASPWVLTMNIESLEVSENKKASRLKGINACTLFVMFTQRYSIARTEFRFTSYHFYYQIKLFNKDLRKLTWQFKRLFFLHKSCFVLWPRLHVLTKCPKRFFDKNNL